MRRPWLLVMAWPVLLLWQFGPLIFVVDGFFVVRAASIVATTVASTGAATHSSAPAVSSSTVVSSLPTVDEVNFNQYDDGIHQGSTDNNDDDDDDDLVGKLSVTFRQGDFWRVPSGQYKYNTVEIKNRHQFESITIHEVTIHSEKTTLLKTVSGEGVGQEWEGDDQIPRQLYVSNDFQRGLSIGPGETADIPLVFVPRFPYQGISRWKDSNIVGDCPNDVDNIDGGGDGSLMDNNLYNNQRPIHVNKAGRFGHHSDDGQQSPSPRLSKAEHLDLVNLLGWDITKVLFDDRPLVPPRRKEARNMASSTRCNRRRNNIRGIDKFVEGHEDLFTVSSEMRLDTSIGRMTIPLTATTIRENMYGFPESIRFRHPNLSDKAIKEHVSEATGNLQNRGLASDFSSSSPEEQTYSMDNSESLGGFAIHDRLVASNNEREIPYPRETVRSQRDSTQTKKSMNLWNDCFDLYLSNPKGGKELTIRQVVISKPALMGLTDYSAPGGAGRDNLVLSGEMREWNHDGPLKIPPGSTDIYVLTVCTRSSDVEDDPFTARNGIDSTDTRRHLERDLGYMQIRTDEEIFVIFLEHSDSELEEEKQGSGDGPGSVVLENGSQNTFLQTIPGHLDFRMTSVSSPDVDGQFGLRNLSPDAVRIMSAAVLIDTQEGKYVEYKDLGLQIKIRLNSNTILETNSSGSGLGRLVVEPFGSLQNIFTVSCSLDPSSSLLSDRALGDFDFNGTVIVRGTLETDIRFEDWKDDMRKNPFCDDHLLVELPISVSILNPRVEAIIDRSTHPYPQLFASQGWDISAMAVSFLFFPLTAFDATKGTEDALPTQLYVGSTKIIHDLKVSSNVANVIELEGGKVVDSEPSSKDSICARFNVTKTGSAPSSPPTGYGEIGHLSLVYKFDIFKRSETQQTFMYPRTSDDLSVPKTCYLEILTSFDEGFGPFRIPLVIFPGHLELSAGVESIDGPVPGMKMGFDNLLSWTKKSDTGLGKLLIKNLPQIMGGRGKDKSDLNLLASYIRYLSKDNERSIKSRFHPILLNMGTIDNGKIAKAPLYFTNVNPLPVQVSIDVAAVEGMSISLRRCEGQSLGDGNSLLDALPTYGGHNLIEGGRFDGQPIAGLLEYLSSDEQALAFTTSFNYRDAVDYDSHAIDRFPFLGFLYEWYSSATFHRNQWPKNGETKSSYACGDEQPPLYDMTSEKSSNKVVLTDSKVKSFILSNNGKHARLLKECTRRSAFSYPNENTIKIPPGGKARFEIQIRGPPESYLESDISQLLATGLVLSTNFGDVMPIFVEFEALQGQLYGSLVNKNGTESSRLEIPLRFSWDSNRNDPDQATASSQAQKHTTGHEDSMEVPLLLRSTFTSPIRLQTIESCNPWFRFVRNGSTENETGYLSETTNYVGFMQTLVDCTDSTGGSKVLFPSYFQCALNWLTDRSRLQPDGCGLKMNKDSVFKHTHLEKVRRSVERANRLLKREYSEKNNLQYLALFSEFSSSSAIKTGRKRGDGIVSNLDVFSLATNNLRVASEHGVNALSSTLRATIEYTSVDSMYRQKLSLAVHDVMAQAALEPPRLFDLNGGRSAGLLSFGKVAVGATATAYVPIRNPTSVPVRVRLAVSARSPTSPNHNSGKSVLTPFVQNRNATDHSEWWIGNGGFYLHDSRGDVMKSHHNISIKAGAGAHVSLLNPSLHAQNVLVMGCAVRCALPGDESHMKVSSTTTAPIGASSVAGITLSGSSWVGSADDNAEVDDPILLSAGSGLPYSGGPSAFAIPYSALDEIVIPPFGTAELGPIIFRPPGRYRTLGCSAIKESGARYWNAAKRDLCQDSKFDSVVYLENSLTGVESVVLTGKTRWKRLVFLDSPEAEDDAFGDIEVLNGKEALVFSGVGNPGNKESNGPLPVLKEVLLHNDGEDDVFVSRIFLSGTNSARIVTKLSCEHGSFKLITCLHEYVRLQPDESLPIVIAHIPTCVFKKEQVELTVETVDDRMWSSLSESKVGIWGSKRGSQSHGYSGTNPFETSIFTLSVGYQMDDTVFSSCEAVTSGRVKYLNTWVDSNVSASHETQSMSSLHSRSSSAHLEGQGSSMLLAELVLLLAAAGLLCFNTRLRSSTVQRVLHANSEQKTTFPRKIVTKKLRSHWNTAFRCFARVDPGSSELQALSREQMRQVVIGHYKAKETTPPAALAAAVFSRDRRAAGGGSARQRTGREAAGNERIRTLSDSLFQNASATCSSPLSDCLPLGLGWKTAFKRGVAIGNSLQTIGPSLTCKKLVQERLTAKEGAAVKGSEATKHLSDNKDESRKIDMDDISPAYEPSTEEEEDSEIIAAKKTRSQRLNLSQNVESTAAEPHNGQAGDVDSCSETKDCKPVGNEFANGSKDLSSENQPISVIEVIVSNKDDNYKHTTREKKAEKKRQAGKGKSNHIAGSGLKGTPPIEINTNVNEASNTTCAASDTHRHRNEAPNISSKDEQEEGVGRNAFVTSKRRKDQHADAINSQKNAKLSNFKLGKGTQAPSTSTKAKASVGSDKSSKSKAKERGEMQSGVRQPKKQSKAASNTVEMNGDKKLKEESNGAISYPTQLRPPPGLAPPPGFGSNTSPLSGLLRTGSGKPNVMLTASSPTLPEEDPQQMLEDMLNSALSNPDVDLNTAAAFQPHALATTSTVATSADVNISGSDLFSRLTGTPSAVTEVHNSQDDDGIGVDGLFSSILPGLTGAAPGGTTGPETLVPMKSNASQPSLPDILEKGTSNNGFDVMDFLDSILNEGSLHTEDDGLQGQVRVQSSILPPTADLISSEARQDLTGGSTNPSGTIESGSSVLVLENPWASEGTLSRAVTYGISFGEDEGKDSIISNPCGKGFSRSDRKDGMNNGNDDGVISPPIFGALSESTVPPSYFSVGTSLSPTGLVGSDVKNTAVGTGDRGRAHFQLLTPSALLRTVECDDDDDEDNTPNLLSSFYAFGDQDEHEGDDEIYEE